MVLTDLYTPKILYHKRQPLNLTLFDKTIHSGFRPWFMLYFIHVHTIWSLTGPVSPTSDVKSYQWNLVSPTRDVHRMAFIGWTSYCFISNNRTIRSNYRYVNKYSYVIDNWTDGAFFTTDVVLLNGCEIWNYSQMENEMQRERHFCHFQSSCLQVQL